MIYDHYTTGGGNYDVALDKTGPLAFLPENCLKSSSPVIPKTAKTQIAIIPHGGQIEIELKDYLTALFDFQKLVSPTKVIPFEFREFQSHGDLNDYVQNSNYMINGTDYPGICFGFEI